MAGRGTAPKDESQRANPRSKPVHEWQVAPGVGWQHGEVPSPPDGLMPASLEAWAAWFAAWFAAYWSPVDVPGLRTLVRLYDQVERGEFQRAGELRLQMDTYGITPKGQQDRRWRPPQGEKPADAADHGGSRYAHLRAVRDVG
jgi:hypothetical protein